MRLHTGQFAAFYEDVEKALDADGPTRFWFRSLIPGFRKEFERWGNDSNYPLRRSLAEVDNANDLGRLIGFAYIHMAYDLPRVIAQKLPQLVDPNYEGVVYLEGQTPATKLNDIWRGFIGADMTLVRTFASHVPSLLPRPFASLTGLLPKKYAKTLEIPALWVVVQRHEAWHNGEKLIGPGNLRLESQLCHQVAESVHRTYAVSAQPGIFDALSLLLQLEPPLLPPIAVIPISKKSREPSDRLI